LIISKRSISKTVLEKKKISETKLDPFATFSSTKCPDRWPMKKNGSGMLNSLISVVKTTGKKKRKEKKRKVSRHRRSDVTRGFPHALGSVFLDPK